MAANSLFRLNINHCYQCQCAEGPSQQNCNRFLSLSVPLMSITFMFDTGLTQLSFLLSRKSKKQEKKIKGMMNALQTLIFRIISLVKGCEKMNYSFQPFCNTNIEENLNFISLTLGDWVSHFFRLWKVRKLMPIWT